MRSAQRDQSAVIQFGARVADAAAGSGIAQPGAIPFTFTRTGTGAYQYNVDPRLTPSSVVAIGDPSTNHGAATGPFTAGTFRVVLLANNVPTNGAHSWACTAVDKRS